MEKSLFPPPSLNINNVKREIAHPKKSAKRTTKREREIERESGYVAIIRSRTTSVFALVTT